MDKGILDVTIIDEISGRHLSVWYDEHNDQRYILTTCKDKIIICIELVFGYVSNCTPNSTLSTSS